MSPNGGGWEGGDVCGILLNHLIATGSGLRLKSAAATEAASAPAVPTPLLIAVYLL